MKIPDNEILWVTFLTDDVPHHIITSNLHRDMYYLYKVDAKGNLKRTKYQSSDPTNLNEKVNKKG